MSGYHYKFHTVNKNLFKLIINQELWFANPKSFNDPYDCNIDVQKIEDTERLIQLVKTKYGQDIREKVEANPNKVDALKEQLRKIAKSSYEKFGICCFSMFCDHILMWSHYADNHKGICLKFDSKYDPDTFRVSSIVRYVEEYPKIEFSYGEGIDEILEVGRYKFLPWSYEQEIRVLKLDGEGTRQFNMACLKEVIFGANCSENDRNTIIGLLLKFGYDNIIFKEAILKEDNFGIEFKNLSPEKIKSESKRIDKQIQKFLEAYTNERLTETSSKMVKEMIEKHFMPQYEELLQDAYNYVNSVESKEEQIEILDEYFPKNKKTILDILEMGDNKNE